jgi:hypothetical protein
MHRHVRCLTALGFAILIALAGKDAAVGSDLFATADHGMQYVGAFRLPTGEMNGTSFSYGGTALAFNPARNSLFMVGHDWQQMVAEVSIPTPVSSSNLNDLPIATVLQPFADPTEGRRALVASDVPGVKIGGLMVVGQTLVGTLFVYYDSAGSTTLSHFTHSVDLTKSSVQGPFAIGSGGSVGGYMTPIPAAWQPQLGGPAITGQCCIPILSRTSFGPSAFAFDPNKLGQTQTLSQLLYYPQAHPLATWDATSELFNGTTKIGGIVFPQGTDTVLYIGRQGVGTYCYGNATLQNPPPPPGPDGTNFCYDPSTGSGKGNHAYPYVYQVWAYRAGDFTAVKQGRVNPWDVKPYTTFRLTFPNTTWHAEIDGVGYDPQTQRIFMTQAWADDPRPLVQVFKLDPAGLTSRPLSAPANIRVIK